MRHQRQIHGTHCKPLHHRGALTDIPSDALLLLRRWGKELIVADGVMLRALSLSGKQNHVDAKVTWCVELPVPPAAIANSAPGIVVAWSAEGRTTLMLVRDDSHCHEVLCIDGVFAALAAFGNEALLALRTADARSGRLLRIDVVRRLILAERPLDDADVDLQLEPTGRWLAITHRKAGAVCVVRTTLDPWRALETAAVANPNASSSLIAPSRFCCHPNPCWCAKCAKAWQGKGHEKPCGCEKPSEVGRDQPGSGGSQAGGGGPPGGGGQPDGSDHPGGRGGGQSGGSWPGSAGTPGSDGGGVVGQGGSVGQHGPGSSENPCWLDLLWRATRIVRTSGFAVATDASGRNLAVIATDSFRLIDERQSRMGFSFALDAQAPVMLIRSLGTSAATAFNLIHLDVLAKLADPIHRIFPTYDPQDSATFYGGLQIESLMSGHAPPNGPIKVLLLPVIEKNQTFSDPDIAHFAGYLDRVMAPHVHDYYVENSFGSLTDISFSMFGRDVGPAAGPLQLPRKFISDYYWPKYDPAKLILTRAAIPAGAQIVLDGRESMQLNVQPDGAVPAEALDVPFAALAFSRTESFFPVEVRFDPTSQLVLKVTTPAGANLTLTLKFPAKTVNLTDDANLPVELGDIATYLDGVFQAAEAAAGLGARLFAKPTVERLTVPGLGFGTLAITVSGATAVGAKLAVTSAAASFPGTDPIGLGGALTGGMDPASVDVQTYLRLMFAIAESRKSLDNNNRLITDVTVSFNAGARTLTTTVPVGDSIGGPTAAVSLSSSSGLADLFTTTSTQPNSATNANNAEALRDQYALFQDAWDAAVHRLQAAGNDTNTIKHILSGWHVAMVIPVEAAVNTPGDPQSVQPWEAWKVTPLSRPFDFRGLEWMTTVAFADDASIQLQAVWTLDFFSGTGKPDVAMICHEMGHGLGFRDLYAQNGYREDLAYLDDWAIMCNHWNMPHHAGYHKQQVGWIPDSRVITMPPAQAAQTDVREALLVPVELWDDNYPADSRAAFGVDATVPVVQLFRLDLGGDGAVYDLIEARQKGVSFSQSLPASPGIIITNALEPWDDQRYSFNGQYRRELQLLNPHNVLQNPGDSFDLAKAPGLPAKGITVTVVDRKLVRDANVFHVKVTRTNTDYIDLYFSSADPYYKNSDLYVDWAGDNPSRKPDDHDRYPLGQPTDQGDAIRIPKSGTELHWIVGRIRNKGQVKAEQVKLEFRMCVPPGGGDRSGNFQPLGTVTLAEVPGGDVPVDAVFQWDVPAGFGGHTCLAVEVADFKIPQDSDGSALASADVWLANNHAQKNVDQFIPLQSSPYDVTEFDYSVHNDAPRPEYAYLEPDGLPPGMKLTVTPRGQVVPPKSTVIFRCKLELDDAVLDAGCRSDRQFRIVTWRRDRESTARWGGVQYKVMPRKRCKVTLTGWWDSSGTVHLSGQVSPDPGGGVLRLRLAFSGTDAVWVPVGLGAGAAFTWQGPVKGDGTGMNAVAAYEGNLLYGPAESAMLQLSPPAPVR